MTGAYKVISGNAAAKDIAFNAAQGAVVALGFTYLYKVNHNDYEKNKIEAYYAKLNKKKAASQ
eukprot:CAMPEP_0117575186 /NCGR_PEP_ID=MMETSP0784-20121206/62066_1 /TAXON_ID=39447 /ORGANISM="" /LENGTH=62 /DNA_ID=CAMNT_0005374227 /DNA_START=20 /DNA_END=208 /DNA_ORIENTATION=+